VLTTEWADAFTAITDFSECFDDYEGLDDWQFSLTVEAANDGVCGDGAVKITFDQWLLCKDISWLQIIRCTDSNYDENDDWGECTGGGVGKSPGDPISTEARCCKDEHDVENLIFVVVVHDGQVKCDTFESDIIFGKNCGGGGSEKNLVAFEINLGPALCGDCYIGKTYTYERKTSGECFPEPTRRVEELFPLL
jgi:hypothetical protein